MLGDLGGRRLGLDGDGAAAHQGHDRRGAGLALGDGVVVGDDEPVAAGQLGRRARVKGHKHGARALKGTSELRSARVVRWESVLSHSAASCAVVWDLDMPALCSTGSAASRTASLAQARSVAVLASLSPSTTLALKIW